VPPPAILKRHETTEVEVRTLTFGDVRPAPPDISTPRPTLKIRRGMPGKHPGRKGLETARLVNRLCSSGRITGAHDNLKPIVS
jgi:hypothetical protein